MEIKLAAVYKLSRNNTTHITYYSPGTKPHIVGGSYIASDFLFSGLRDRYNNDIYFDLHIVRFTFNTGKGLVELIGVPFYDETELRLQFDIFNNEQFTCLNYMYDQIYGTDMSDFEIIGNKIEHPHLLNQNYENSNIRK